MSNRRVAILIIALVAVMALGVLVTATVAAQAVRVVRDRGQNAVHISEVLGDEDGVSLSVNLGERGKNWTLPVESRLIPKELRGEGGFAFIGEFEMVEGPGLVIVGVGADSPAAEAGVERGDILLSVNGTEVDGMVEMHDVLADAEDGDAFEITVLHGDDERTLTLLADGDADLPMLGMMVHPSGMLGDVSLSTVAMGLPHEMMGLPGMLHEGVHVAGLVEDGPAEAAGVEAGEIITALDGQVVAHEEELLETLERYEPGDRVTLSLQEATLGPRVIVKRFLGKDDEETATITAGEIEVTEGEDAERADDADDQDDADEPEAREIDVVLGEHPDDPERAYLGIELSPSIAAVSIIEPGEMGKGGLRLPHLPELPDIGAFELPDGLTQAVIVGTVADDAPADAAGLAMGDFVMAIEGETVEDADTLVDAVGDRKPGDKLALTVFSPGDDEPRDVTVTLGEHPDEPGNAYLGTGNLGVIQVSGDGDYRSLNLWFDAGPSIRIHGDGGFHLPDIELPEELQELLDDLHDEIEDELEHKFEDKHEDKLDHDDSAEGADQA